MKNRSYNVKIDLNEDGSVQHSNCTCPRGNFKCHHMAAVMIYAHKNIPSTSADCRWSRVKTVEGDKPQKAEDLFPPGKEYRATKAPLKEEDIKKFQDSLRQSNFNVGFTWLMSEEPAPSLLAEVPEMEKILFSREYLASDDRTSFIKSVSQISRKDIENVARITVGQCENPLWFAAKKYRLTASNFGKVLSAYKRNRYPPSLFKQLKGDYNFKAVRSLQWGRDNEQTALRCLEEVNSVKIEKTGVWLHESGFLGASPDGIIKNENAIVEVKCPYIFRKSENIIESIRSFKTYILMVNDENLMLVNKEHDYYHQIQGQLHITGAQKCYLVVWSPSGYLITEIIKDDDWAGNIKILHDFFLYKFLGKFDF
ncbi:uncharacterized protein LOC111057589 [Nilaparvata lugens]|uniref:uncharacterized protein LOC111057589 n=1 Tax=Nilaparvata lugens TaxID=108931 RepID=UPI00193E281F|nr:uncharacterized protein LOC111057589 [Nilaparvata lugens]